MSVHEVILSYNAEKNYSPVSLMAVAPLLMVAHPSFGIKTVSDLVTPAKSRSGQLPYGSDGVAHLGGELLKFMTGIQTVHIAYKGAGPAMADLLGGHIGYTFGGPFAALPNIKAGKVIGIAVTTKNRAASLPDIPAIAETIPGYEVRAWYCIVAPVRTPKVIIDKLNKDIAAAMQTPLYCNRWSRGCWRNAGVVCETYQARNCNVDEIGKGGAFEARMTVHGLWSKNRKLLKLQ